MQIWGYKTGAMFDLWSIEHFINGIALAGTGGFLTKKVFQKDDIAPIVEKKIGFIVLLTLALLWEVAEHYVEAGVLSGGMTALENYAQTGILPTGIGARVTVWFQGVEHWTNRLIGDTLTVMLGWYVYTRKSILAWPAKIVSLIWLAVHVFAFPDSMYLHRLLFPQ